MRKHLHKYLPKREAILQNKYLSRFAHLLHHRELWHLQRRSLAGGLALGFFIESTPILGHLPLFLVGALLLRVNIPAGIAANMLINPFTMAPYFYFAYRLGERVTALFGLSLKAPGSPPLDLTQLFSNWELLFSNGGHHLGTAYLITWIGCLIIGTLAAFIAYYGTLGLWRVAVIYRWRRRRKRSTP